MMFKECTCPSCGKTIQVPEGQESCICMFCGSEVRIAEALGEKKEVDLVAYGEHYNQAMSGMDDIIAGCSNPLKGFKKETYEGRFEEFSSKFRPVYEAAEAVYRCEEHPEEWIQKLCGRLIDSAQADINTCKSKTSKNQRQMDLNFLVSIYLIPSVLKYPYRFAEPFVDTLLAEWNKAFQATIGKANYDVIQAGFRRKLCYITTAVCEGLGKGADCEELAILKRYRDENLMQTADGRALVEDYYDIAPTIVKRLEREPERDEIYQELYRDYLLPCIRFIREEDYSACRDTYSEMVRKLKARYLS